MKIVLLFVTGLIAGSVFAQVPPALPNPTPAPATSGYKVPDGVVHSNGYFVTGTFVLSYPQSSLVLMASEDGVTVYKGYAYLKDGQVFISVIEKQLDGKAQAIRGFVVRQDGNPLVLYQGKLFANDKIMVIETS